MVPVVSDRESKALMCGRIPVTNRNGKLLGVIAQADIATTDEIPKHEVADVLRTISEPKQS